MQRLSKKRNGAVASKTVERLEKAPTGIVGLDEITLGGLPRGRATLICGSAGCGKTMLGIEFLVKGVREYWEPGVFVAFEETKNELVLNPPRWISISVNWCARASSRSITSTSIRMKPPRPANTPRGTLHPAQVRDRVGRREASGAGYVETLF